MQNTLLFKSEASEVLETNDGSTLDIDCTVAYGNEAVKKGNTMLGTISTRIADSECAETINAISQPALQHLEIR